MKIKFQINQQPTDAEFNYCDSAAGHQNTITNLFDDRLFVFAYLGRSTHFFERLCGTYTISI